MSATETVIGLRLDQLDPLLFRDGRPFDAASRVAGGLPTPQTLAGAIRTAMLAQTNFNFRNFAAARRSLDIREALRKAGAPLWWLDVRMRGPWLAIVSRDGVVEPLFDKPATLYKSKAGAWERTEPLEEGALPGWTSELRPLWKRAEPDSKAEGGWLTLTGLRQFLSGKPVDPGEMISRSLLFAEDDRVGIEIDKHALTSADGMLYAVRFLTLNPKLHRECKCQPPYYPSRFDGGSVCFYAEVILPPGADKTDFFEAPTPVPFGGEGKYVGATRVPACDWPKLDVPRSQGIWYLASPAFPDPKQPDFPLLTGGGKVVAAASGAGIAVSGWDVARNGPRPTRFAVPAGAVYFVENPVSPEHDSLDPDPANRLEGWGFALPGIW